jgi:hypothetical protein
MPSFLFGHFMLVFSTAIKGSFIMSDGTNSDGVSSASTALASAVNTALENFIDSVIASVNSDTIASANASAAAAAQSATAAAASAATASQAATTSSTNSGSSGQSATWASQSATAAAASAAQAQASQASAAQAFTSTQDALAAFAQTATSLTAFMHTYNTYFLGAGANDPTVDGNGQPVQAGAMYENTTSNKLRVYSGTQWNNIDYSIAAQLSAAQASATAAAASATAAGASASAAATSAGLSQAWAAQTSGNVNGTSYMSALQYAQAAAASGTAASTSAGNANTAATEAANSATQAASSATTASNQAGNASNSAVAASNSATAAQTSATGAASSATSASTQASAASGSATAAATSATNAANSATAAATTAANLNAFGMFSGTIQVKANTNLTSPGYGKIYEVPIGDAGGYTVNVPAPAAGDTSKCLAFVNLSSGALTLNTSAGVFNTAFGINVSSITLPSDTTLILQMDGANFNGIAGSGALGSALVPTNAAGLGQFVALVPQGTGNDTFVLPGTASQKWAYFVANAGGGQQAAGVGAGGSGVLGPFTANNPIGFAWRVG